MAIELGCVPAAALEAVSAGVIDGAPAALSGSRNHARAERGALSLAMPHRVAYLPFDRVKPELDLRKAAEMGSWRFLIHEKQVEAGAETFVPIAAATAIAVHDGYQFGDLNNGPLVAGTEQAVRRAENLEQVRNGRFETYLLMIPSLYVVALWLQDRGGYGKTDIYLPMPPSHSDLRPFAPMRSAEFVKVLNRLAAEAAADPIGRARGYFPGTRPLRVEKGAAARRSE